MLRRDAFPILLCTPAIWHQSPPASLGLHTRTAVSALFPEEEISTFLLSQPFCLCGRSQSHLYKNMIQKFFLCCITISPSLLDCFSQYGKIAISPISKKKNPKQTQLLLIPLYPFLLLFTSKHLERIDYKCCFQFQYIEILTPNTTYLEIGLLRDNLRLNEVIRVES